MSTEEIVEILKSGNFTIAYHDNGAPYLYNGKFEYDDLPKKETYEFGTYHDGYIPEIVFMLVEALGGITQTI